MTPEFALFAEAHKGHARVSYTKPFLSKEERKKRRKAERQNKRKNRRRK